MVIENIIWGGNVQKLLVRLKLDKDPNAVVLRKIIFFSSITWIPLLAFSAIQSGVYNPELRVSLSTDLVVWARFFIALPLLFYIERLIKNEVGLSVSHFINSGIISENNHTEFEAILKKISRLRDSKIVEPLIMALSYFIVLFYWRVADQTNMSLTWLYPKNHELSLAGYCYYAISAPIFQFFLYRMVWKFILWFIFLYKISRMDLNLVPVNPDLSAGLNFLGITTVFFGYLGLAQGCVASAQISEIIITNKIPLADFKITILINITALLFLFFSPMLLFIKKLFRVRINGIMEYGVIGQQYTGSFHNKWVNNINPQNEQLLGTADIQSLADLYNSYQIVDKMKVIPIHFRQIIILALIIAAPFFPLLFFVLSPLEILSYLVQIFV